MFRFGLRQVIQLCKAPGTFHSLEFYLGLHRTIQLGDFIRVNSATHSRRMP